MAPDLDPGHRTGPPAPPAGRWLRRGFVAALLAALAGVLAIAGRLLGHTPPAEKPRPVRFTAAEVRSGDQVLVKSGVALVKAESGLIGLLLVCPHLGCRPRWQARQKEFVCPCHGSRFARDGARRHGPASRGLTRLEVIRRADGSVRLDPARPVTSGR